MPTTSLRVAILRPLVVRRGGSPVDLGPTKQRAVFAFLALHAGERVTSDALLEAVWGDGAPPTARNLVHTYVARLRHAVEPDTPPRSRVHVITSARSGYQLLLDNVDVDAIRFVRLVGEAKASLESGDWARALDLLGDAMRLWRDPSLADIRALLRTHRELDALAERWTEAALAFVTIGLDHGRASTVLPIADRLAARAPQHEGIQARCLAALDQAGQRPAWQVAEPTRPPWRGVGPGVTALLGVDRDLSSLVELVSLQRLVTIAGPPGCGKSALALRTAALVRDNFGDGVAVVEAADTDAGDFAAAVVRAVRDDATTTDPVAVLGDRELLLVMDNMEHLVETGSGVVDRILRGCGYVSALVTTREPLGLPYETVWRVRPLPVPAEHEIPSLDNPALRLFAEAAARVRPGFRVDGDNAPTVAAICRALDGVPLAIELAAASLATDSLDALRDKVSDPLRQIRPLRRGWPAHHRTLGLALRRSVDCLTPMERSTFARLGGLQPDFTLVDAARECGWYPWEGVDLRAILARLVAKSVLLVRHGSAGTRYRMLGIVHRLAVEMRSADAGEASLEQFCTPL
jgi:predicted ATPase/DNA-binding SARP family transcriptional activator